MTSATNDRATAPDAAPATRLRDGGAGNDYGAARVSGPNEARLHRHIGWEVSALVELRRRSAKELYPELGLDKGQWSRRINGKVPFTVWELACLARVLEAPTGWPFASFQLASDFDAWRRRKRESD